MRRRSAAQDEAPEAKLEAERRAETREKERGKRKRGEKWWEMTRDKERWWDELIGGEVILKWPKRE